MVAKHFKKLLKYPIKQSSGYHLPAIIPALGQVVVFGNNFIVANILLIF